MATNYIYQDLKADIQSCKLAKSLLQGSTNRTFQFTLLDRDSKVLLGSGAKVTVTVLYNPRMVDNQFVYDGSHVLSPTDIGYNVTISEAGVSVKYSTVDIPFVEEFVNYAGTCELVLEIVDTDATTYTYGMYYTVDRNDAYFPKSTPNNLPSYKSLAQKVADIHTQVTANTGNITANTNSIANKANANLNNVGDFSHLPDGTLLVKKDNTIKDSGIKLIGNDINAPTKTITVKEVNTAPNTINIGDNISISENGGFLEYHINSLNKYYILLDYDNDSQTGSIKPIYYERGAKEHIVIQSDDGVDMKNISTINFGTPNFERQIQYIYFKFIDGVDNLKMRILVNGRPIAYIPSKNAWNGLEKGNTLPSGVQSVFVDPFFSNLASYSVVFELKADTPINLKGNGTLPYYELDINRIERKPIALQEEVDAILVNPTDIRDRLQALGGDDRLDASAVKNINNYVISPVKHYFSNTNTITFNVNKENIYGVQLYELDGVTYHRRTRNVNVSFVNDGVNVGEKTITVTYNKTISGYVSVI